MKGNLSYEDSKVLNDKLSDFLKLILSYLGNDEINFRQNHFNEPRKFKKIKIFPRQRIGLEFFKKFHFSKYAWRVFA